MKKVFHFFIGVLLALSLTFSLKAQTKDGAFQAGLGIGAGWNPPVRFDLDLFGEYFLNDRFSIGLDFDIFVRGATGFNVLPFGRYHFEIEQWREFSPYVGVGAGVLINTNKRGWFDFMLPELGFLYELTPHLLMGPNVSFHILAGSNTTWDLQTVGQLIYRF